MKVDNHVVKSYLEIYKVKEGSTKNYYKFDEKDFVKNYLSYWIKYKNLSTKNVEIDKLWGEEIEKEYHIEFNSMYDYSFDTILSFWYPLEIYINWKDRKNNNYIRGELGKQKNKVTKANLPIILEDWDEKLKPCNHQEQIIYDKLESLAQLSSSRANVMKIPRYKYGTEYSFNVYHYDCSCDQIWLFLHHIIKNNDCFENDDKMLKWIEDEKLYICFENNDVNSKIKYYQEYEDNKFIWLYPNFNNEEEFYKQYNKLLDMYIKFIEERQEEQN